MRRALGWAAVLLVLGCPEERTADPSPVTPIRPRSPVAPPKPAPPAPPTPQAETAVDSGSPESPPPAGDASPSLWDDPTGAVLAALHDRGIQTREALHARLTSPDVVPIEREPVLLPIGDIPGLEELWTPMVRKNPDDLLSREYLSRAFLLRGDSAAVVQLLEPTLKRLPDRSDGTATSVLFRSILPWLCEALALEGRVSAHGVCMEAAAKTDTSHGHRAQARIAMAARKLELAKELMSVAVSRNVLAPENWYWLGVANALLGKRDVARSAWGEALRVAPGFTPALKALATPPTSVEAARAEELRQAHRVAARLMGRCGRVYASLALPDRAERCFAAAEKLDPGITAALKIVMAPGGAAAVDPGQLRAAVALKHPLALAIAAEVALMEGATDDAVGLLARAIAQDPGSPEVSLAALHLCEALSKGPSCSDPLRRRLRWGPRYEETDNRSLQVDSRYVGYVAPRLTGFVLQPYAERDDFPELDGLPAILEQRFPSVRFELRPLKRTPKSAIDVRRPQVDHDGNLLRRGQIIDDLMFAAMPRERGLIAVVDRDLTPFDGNFYFATMELETVRGVVSAARFRTESGEPAGIDRVLTGKALEKARERIANQLTSTVGKLIGLSFPCRDNPCVMRYPRSREEFDAKGGEFCPTHKAELRKLLK